MSRSWRTTQLIAAADFVWWQTSEVRRARENDEAVSSNGDALPKIPGTTERNRFLTDGRNVISVMISQRGFLFEVTSYGDNDPNDILWAIDRDSEAGLVDEDHPDYWQAYEWREVRDSPDREPSDDSYEKELVIT